ncbi:LOW QUALITY PROTEIN: hypothetical protein OSB04_013377 [Centaurea solstitialis]|uniref:Uncharacterized protein n=1 Tax=Centaurea solstitialis TaxID=347529 RepID=A0AA38TD53_9ASTR|nr:LOW QUALITY PROTEIN: hypothetical protein OSB04_013377 [Centaurea solstitialis]
MFKGKSVISIIQTIDSEHDEHGRAKMGTRLNFPEPTVPGMKKSKLELESVTSVLCIWEPVIEPSFSVSVPILGIGIGNSGAVSKDGYPLPMLTPTKEGFIMNLFGVLKYKKMGEDFVRNSGLPYNYKLLQMPLHFNYTTRPRILRWFTPGRLTDGPYTSYHLNTLLKATAGEVSRLVVAEACIQALDIDFTQGQIYEINSVLGDGPGSNTEKWKELFKAAQLQIQ